MVIKIHVVLYIEDAVKITEKISFDLNRPT